ncbi:MAG TPA: asparagine--tRNA ligase [Anaerolineae bacterium]|nr:asparagine--tRNA ligase [Anaerolineae bacterium]HQJ50532.1 asparagine--tRNA ligase [Anaerolineae bacterium]
MPKWVYVKDIAAAVGQQVTLKGWLYDHTDKGKLQFLLVRDGTGVIQCVASQKDLSPEAFAAAQAAAQESSLIVTGTVRADSRAPGGFELSLSNVEIVQLAKDYPITPKDHGIEFLMQHRHLWIRSARQNAILRIRAEIIKAARDWLDSNGFVNIDTPILTPSSCEDTTTLFETTYFDDKAYLAQSGQLYNEATIGSFGKVYCFGPTFRAEKSKTRRHLTEFWMVEPEMAYIDLDGCMEVEEQFVSYIVQTVLKNRVAELRTLERDVSRLDRVIAPFPRITYDDAVDLLNQKGLPFKWGDDFGAPHETVIGESFDRPVFVHHYPSAFKAFYMEETPGRPETCLSVDLLASEGYGEIIGGGQRTASLELLEKRIQQHKLPRSDYEWYLDLRRYGSVPHSGFGLGIERTVAWICGISHIRETIAFPRMLEKIYP